MSCDIALGVVGGSGVSTRRQEGNTGISSHKDPENTETGSNDTIR